MCMVVYGLWLINLNVHKQLPYTTRYCLIYTVTFKFYLCWMGENVYFVNENS